VTLKRSTLDNIASGQATVAKPMTDGDIRIEGNAKALQDVMRCLDSFEFWFDVVTANPPPKN
jgi:alkyl sulfatase BDS1-like metallo-beta-lactamase superfamily hydrolase